MDYALDLAEKYSAHVTLLTVFEPIVVLRFSPTTVPPLSVKMKEKYKQGLKTGHKKVLREPRKKFGEAHSDLGVSRTHMTFS
ncbi:MAG: hypothetical protein ACOC6G_01495 [Thermoproteota archaeon]